jgi:Tol biopolymer transport system component
MVLRGLVLAVLLAGGVASLVVRAQSTPAGTGAGQRFQEAVTLMDVRRDYAAAVRLFEEVASGPDRRLAARALVYLGICYERLGRDEAARAYQRVISDFADQPAAVRDARVRLGAIERAQASARPPTPPTITLRQAWPERPPDAVAFGELSASGRWLVVFQAGEGRPASIVDTATGKPSGAPFILNPADAAGVRPCRDVSPAAPSPDGRELAFACGVAEKRQELRVLSHDGTAHVLVRTEPEHVIRVSGWTAGGTLVTLVTGPDRRAQVLLVSAGDGTRRDGPSLAAAPRTLGLSPDERWLVYDNPSAQGDDDDIYIAPLSNGPATVLLGGTANDMHPVWTPDGRHVLFVSDRTGTSGLWLLPVADGQALEAPRVVQQDIGRVAKPFGLTGSGEYLYFRQLGFPDAHAVQLGPDGSPEGPPAVLSRAYSGSNMYPTWSPEGAQVAFVAQLGFRSRLVIGIRDLRADAQRSLQTGMAFLGPLRWSPDGRTLLAYGQHGTGEWGLFAIDAESGATRPVLTVPPSDESFLGAFDWSPDGTSVYYVWTADGAPALLRRRALATGVEETAFTVPEGQWGAQFALSPVTGNLAVVTFREGGSLLQVQPADGGVRTVLETSGSDRLYGGVGWLPDGRHVIVARARLDDETRQGSLWRVDVQTGTAVDLGVRMLALRDVRVSPDGTRVAFTAGQYSRETWLLANFLPPSVHAPAVGRGAERRR